MSSDDEESNHDDRSETFSKQTNKKQQVADDGFSLADFLMGNIDEKGKLIKDSYDEDVVKALGSSFVTSSFNDLEATKNFGTLLRDDGGAGDGETSQERDLDGECKFLT